jgi:hypothetical protein
LQAAQAAPGGLVFLPRMTQWFDKLIFVLNVCFEVLSLSKSSIAFTTLIFIHEEKKEN